MFVFILLQLILHTIKLCAILIAARFIGNLSSSNRTALKVLFFNQSEMIDDHNL